MVFAALGLVAACERNGGEVAVDQGKFRIGLFWQPDVQVVLRLKTPEESHCACILLEETRPEFTCGPSCKDVPTTADKEVMDPDGIFSTETYGQDERDHSKALMAGTTWNAIYIVANTALPHGEYEASATCWGAEKGDTHHVEPSSSISSSTTSSSKESALKKLWNRESKSLQDTCNTVAITKSSKVTVDLKGAKVQNFMNFESLKKALSGMRATLHSDLKLTWSDEDAPFYRTYVNTKKIGTLKFKKGDLCSGTLVRKVDNSATWSINKKKLELLKYPSDPGNGWVVSYVGDGEGNKISFSNCNISTCDQPAVCFCKQAQYSFIEVSQTKGGEDHSQKTWYLSQIGRYHVHDKNDVEDVLDISKSISKLSFLAIGDQVQEGSHQDKTWKGKSCRKAWLLKNPLRPFVVQPESSTLPNNDAKRSWVEFATCQYEESLEQVGQHSNAKLVSNEEHHYYAHLESDLKELYVLYDEFGKELDAAHQDTSGIQAAKHIKSLDDYKLEYMPSAKECQDNQKVYRQMISDNTVSGDSQDGSQMRTLTVRAFMEIGGQVFTPKEKKEVAWIGTPTKEKGMQNLAENTVRLFQFTVTEAGEVSVSLH